jgi:hypothetical protein
VVCRATFPCLRAIPTEMATRINHNNNRLFLIHTREQMTIQSLLPFYC